MKLSAAVLGILLAIPAYAQDVKFVALTGLTVGTAVYDIQTTYNALRRCATCVEVNPVMRLSRGKAIAVSLGLTASVATGSLWLKNRGSRLWWVPMVVSSGLHVWAGRNNQNIARSN